MTFFTNLIWLGGGGWKVTRSNLVVTWKDRPHMSIIYWFPLGLRCFGWVGSILGSLCNWIFNFCTKKKIKKMDQLNETWHVNFECRPKYKGSTLYLASQRSHARIHSIWKKPILQRFNTWHYVWHKIWRSLQGLKIWSTHIVHEERSKMTLNY